MKVYLDTSVLFAAVHSESGGARLILQLGEAGAMSLWIGPRVLREAEGVLDRKSPRSKGYFALLLDRSRVQIGGEADAFTLDQARLVVDYAPDAQVVAEALAAGAECFVSFDQEHLLGNQRIGELPFPVGTAGDFLAWYRAQLMDESD